MGEKITKNEMTKFLSSNYTLAFVIVYTVMVASQILNNSISYDITAIFSILECVGLWLIYTSAKSNNGINQRGFTFVKVNIIVSAVCNALMSILVLFIGVVFMVVGNSDLQIDSVIDDIMNYAEAYGIDDLEILNQIKGTDSSIILSFVEILGIVFILFGVIYLILSVLYGIYSVKTLNSIKNVTETGIPDSYISLFVVVMSIISAVITGFSCLSSVILIFAGYFLSFLNCAAALAVYIMIAKGLLNYRDLMKKTEEKVAGLAEEPMQGGDRYEF